MKTLEYLRFVIRERETPLEYIDLDKQQLGVVDPRWVYRLRSKIRTEIVTHREANSAAIHRRELDRAETNTLHTFMHSCLVKHMMDRRGWESKKLSSVCRGVSRDRRLIGLRASRVYAQENGGSAEVARCPPLGVVGRVMATKLIM